MNGTNLEEVNIEKNADPSQYDLAHALYTAGFLNLLIRRSNYINMANYSPMVNTRGLIYANGKGVLLRTSFHVFKIYCKCSGGFSLDIQVNSPNLKDTNALILDVSSIRMNDDLIYVYVINRDDENDAMTKFEIPGFSVKKGNALILTANDLRSFNDFKSQDSIISRDYEIDAYGETFDLTIPRQSICLIELDK